MDRPQQKGFSLVELAIVLVVAGLIMAMGAPALHKYLESYRVSDAARQISSELRIARQKAVTNGTRNFYFAGTGVNAGIYWTGIQTPLANGAWSSVAWTAWSMPQNTKQLSPSFGGINEFFYGPDGRPINAIDLSTPVSGSVKIASVSAAVTDTAQVNVDLTGEVWQ